MNKPVDVSVINTKVFIGLTEQVALELARDSEVRARVSSREGRPLITTRDLNRERINLDIEQGRVVGCTLG